jgi:hypothetical protein
MPTDTEFTDVLYIDGPLRFDGYRFLEFYRANKNLPQPAQSLMNAVFRVLHPQRLRQTLARYPL